MSTSSPLPYSRSSPASSRAAHARRTSFSGQLAFLVHSQESVANHMPPDVDNKALARQKRRRTSKEDEDFLKAEYIKNPKPDKTARLEIVRKVALGEKEVQIWFQSEFTLLHLVARNFTSFGPFPVKAETLSHLEIAPVNLAIIS
ncbi:hypothetical protein NX059_001194 [Plenodomus lindquistii]|nr:hypothetical protein NX059_001194 [Plenodomus lindquistii]